MRCYFLRHGIAVPPERWQGNEFDRPLTGEGRERMAREAKTLAALELDFDVIVTSPLLRAKQTADIVAERLKMTDRVVQDARLDVGFDLPRLAMVLRDYPDANAIALVGHEPSMSQTIGALVGAARIAFKKGGLACVDLPQPASLVGELLWLLPPKVLAL